MKNHLADEWKSLKELRITDKQIVEYRCQINKKGKKMTGAYGIGFAIEFGEKPFKAR
jgi:hypothetical protein